MFDSSDTTVSNSTSPLTATNLRDQVAGAAAAALAQARNALVLQSTLQSDKFQSTGSNTGNLSVGSRGSSVAQLQATLQAKGYFHQQPTGYYGQITQGAVKAFQRDQGISQTGVVGPQTRAALAQGTPQPGTQNAQPAAASNGSTPTTHVNTPFYSMKTSNDCYTQARAMAAAAGAHVPRGLGNGLQVETKSPNGTVSINAANAQKAQGYINSELAAGRPVMVGVMHPGGRHNNGLADHFVTITWSGTDAQGRSYYTFNDPGSKVRGSDQNPSNRFYVGANGNLFKPGGQSGYVVDRAYTLAWVGTSAESRQ
jgi:peptidoglycan hydrolase-like protein with peptidoglycan-binding domain